MTSYLRFKGTTGAAHRKRRRKKLAKRRVCHICGRGLNPSEMTVDHIVPRSRGGCGEAWNLRAAHYACNQVKGAAREDSHEYRTAAMMHRLFGICLNA